MHGDSQGTSGLHPVFSVAFHTMGFSTMGWRPDKLFNNDLATNVIFNTLFSGYKWLAVCFIQFNVVP